MATSGFGPEIVTSATRPSSPFVGQGIYETDTRTTLIWDGSAWWPTAKGFVGDSAYTAPTSGLDSVTNSYGLGALFQPDGKAVIWGYFTVFGSISSFSNVQYVARLNTNGTLDTAFSTNVGTGPNGSIEWIELQSDGKLLVGGAFSTWSGTTVNRIVRLNADGTRDTAFTTNAGTAANSTVSTIALQSDGKIIVGGSFTTWNGVSAINRIARLNADGTRDTAFTTNVGTASNGQIIRVRVDTSNRIVVAGFWNTWNGTSLPGYLLRLNSDGTRDTTFSTNVGSGGNDAGTKFIIQSDGKILLNGTITSWNGVTVPFPVRLNSDGTRDTAWTTAIGTGFAGGNQVQNLVQQPSDGKIVMVGNLTSYNGVFVPRIVRVTLAGAIDTAFSSSVGAGPNDIPQGVALSGTRLLVVGQFTTWGSPLTPARYLAALNF